MISVKLFCTLCESENLWPCENSVQRASQKTYGQARIARYTRMAIGNVPKLATKSDTHATAYWPHIDRLPSAHQGCLNCAKLLQRLAICNWVQMSSSAIWLFGADLEIPRLRGAGIGHWQAWHKAGATQHKLHIFIIPSKHLELVSMP